ncbi:hypothetical protein ACS0TY_003202 [Phlomoides rotata]
MPHTVILNGKEKGELPIEAFSRVQELFNGEDWVDTGDDAALWLLKQLSVLNDVKYLSMLRRMSGYSSPLDSEEENNAFSIADSLDCAPEFNFLDDRSSMDSNSEEVSVLRPSEDLLTPIISTPVDLIQFVIYQSKKDKSNYDLLCKIFDEHLEMSQEMTPSFILLGYIQSNENDITERLKRIIQAKIVLRQ